MKFNELSKELQELWTRGVDHSVFNEEWANGVVKFNATFDAQYFKHIFTDQLQSVFCPFDMLQHERYSLLSVAKIDSRFSMATPYECAAAGIDYVPFMGWRDIESAPTDETSVLLYTDFDDTVIGWRRNYMFRPVSLHEAPFTSHSERRGCEDGDGMCSFELFLAKKWMPLPLV